MHIVLLIPEYLLWHYTAALRLCLNIVSNFVWFTYHFFSVPILLKSFFSPLKKVDEKYRSSFRHSLPIETIIEELISRLIGLVFRTSVIFFGVGLSAMVALIGLAFFAVWFLLPLLVAVFVFEGIRNLFI